MKKNLTKAVGGILLGVVLLTALAACGGSPPGSDPPPPAPPQATASATRQPTPASVPTAAATPAPAPTQSAVLSPVATVSAGGGDLLARGKVIFEKTGGGVGCAFCHGLDGRGKGPAQVEAPNIRNKTEADIRTAAAGGVPMMSIVKLSDAEFEAVAAYLQYLSQQP